MERSSAIEAFLSAKATMIGSSRVRTRPTFQRTPNPTLSRDGERKKTGETSGARVRMVHIAVSAADLAPASLRVRSRSFCPIIPRGDSAGFLHALPARDALVHG